MWETEVLELPASEVQPWTYPLIRQSVREAFTEADPEAQALVAFITSHSHTAILKNIYDFAGNSGGSGDPPLLPLLHGAWLSMMED